MTISDFEFAPATLTVKHGTKVPVTNEDSTAHTATADDGTTFDTGTLDPKSSPTTARASRAVWHNRCSIHPFHPGHDLRSTGQGALLQGATAASCAKDRLQQDARATNSDVSVRRNWALWFSPAAPRLSRPSPARGGRAEPESMQASLVAIRACLRSPG